MFSWDLSTLKLLKKKKKKKKKQKDKIWKQTIKSFYYTSSQFENKQTKLQVF